MPSTTQASTTPSMATPALIRQGNQVCDWLNLGYSEYQIQRHVYYNTGASVSWAGAGQFVAIAEDYMC